MNNRIAHAHMKAAYQYAALSYCKRRQVGCVIVKDGTIIAIGYNGTLAGEDNTCEHDNGTTKSITIHAEDNALRKLITSPNTSTGSSVFITTSPCLDCAMRLVNADVNAVYYNEKYNNEDGISFLKKHGILVVHLNIQ